MKRSIALILAIALSLALAACGGGDSSTPASTLPASVASVAPAPSVPEPEPAPGPDLATTAGKLQQFAANTTAKLVDAGENTCYSPLSLYMALALVSTGAEGETLDELLAVLLAQDEGVDALAAGMGEIMRTLPFSYGEVEEEPEPTSRDENEPPEVPSPDYVYWEDFAPHALAIANSAWVSDEFVLTEAFEATATGLFEAAAYSVDFENPATGGQISDWVDEQTHGLLHPEYDLDTETRLALVNTVYLADSWRDKFYEAENTEDTFYPEEDDPVDCTYMNSFMAGEHYLRGENYTGVSLFLNGERDSRGKMTFILPDEGTPADTLLADPAVLAGMMADLTTWENHKVADITLQLPKFEFGSILDPADALQALGVNLVFDDTFSQLSGLAVRSDGSPTRPLYISEIQQDCHIAIDEDGVQAAAATMIAAPETTAMMEDPDEIDLIFDRPFIFLVSYNNLPLFIGVVANPTIN